jgi:hypothetical protein
MNSSRADHRSTYGVIYGSSTMTLNYPAMASAQTVPHLLIIPASIQLMPRIDPRCEYISHN